MEARRIMPEEWNYHWSNISEALDLIPRYWSYHWTKKSIYDDVMSGELQAWGFGKEPGMLNVIVLTKVAEFPANRVLQVLLAWGTELDRVAPIIVATMIRFAGAAGCRYIEVLGRDGWLKKVPGLEKVASFMRLEVTNLGVH